MILSPGTRLGPCEITASPEDTNMNPALRRHLGAAIALALFGLIAAPPAAQAQKENARTAAGGSALDLTQPYLFVDAEKLETLERELNDAAAAGYRAQRAWLGRQLTVMLTKTGGGATTERIQYAVVEAQQKDLERQLGARGAQGFRAVPRTALLRSCGCSDHATDRIVLLMQRSPAAEAKYDYAVLTAGADVRPTSANKSFVEQLADARYGPRFAPLPREPFEQALRRIGESGFSLVAIVARTQVVTTRIALAALQTDVIFIAEKASALSAASAERYRAVTGTPGVMLQIELNAASADGYRLVAPPLWITPSLLFVLEKAAESERQEYLVAGGTTTMELDYALGAVARLGFRAVPGFAFENPPLVVMEKSPKDSPAYEYTLLEGQIRPGQTPVSEEVTPQALAAAAVNGWTPADVAGPGTLMLLAKAAARPAEAGTAVGFSPSQSLASVRRLDTVWKIGTTQKELNEIAAQGYRLVRIPFTEAGLSLAMEKVAEPSARFEYLLVTEQDDKKMELALNGAAARGFHLVPGFTATTFAMAGTQTTLVMEKGPGTAPAPSLQYRVIGATRLSTFDRELDQAKQEGGEVVAMVGSRAKNVLGPHVAILERTAAK